MSRKKSKTVFVLLLCLALATLGNGCTRDSDKSGSGNPIQKYAKDKTTQGFGYAQIEMLNEKLKDALVLYAGSTKAYHNNAEIDISRGASPIVKDQKLLVPAEFVIKCFGGTMKWDKNNRKADIKIAGKTSTITYDISPEDDLLLLPVEELADALGLKLFYDERGLAVMSKEDVFNSYSDIYLIDEAVRLFVEVDDVSRKNAFIKLPKFINYTDNNRIFFVEPNLDLAHQVATYYKQLGDPLVSLGPAIVAGEGAYAENHTMVRVFNQHQVAIAQFLAYPASVRGGVQVAAAAVNTQTVIATAPIMDSATREIRIFDINGGMHMKITPATELKSPFVISTGRFVENKEEQLAVASLQHSGGKTPVHVFSLVDGSLLKKVEIDLGETLDDDVLQMSARHGDTSDSLILYYQKNRKLYETDLNQQKAQYQNITLHEKVSQVFESAFEGEYYAAATRDVLISELISIDKNLNSKIVNVGHKENKFFSTIAEPDDKSYVDHANFVHYRSDYNNPILQQLNSSNVSLFRTDSYSEWAKNAFPANLKEQYHNSNNMWEPCFTHRWFKIASGNALAEVIDPKNGLPRYMAISKDNDIKNYHELDAEFLNATYANGIPELDKMRYWPLREFLRNLAVEFRGENGEPERLVAVSPVHEQEINVPGSVGDYNPYMIEGFRHYLLELYGSVNEINKRFDTNFKTFDEIDAPRDSNRGVWDAYGENGNEYFLQWVFYSRYMVNRRIIEAYREAILAGFPPETIKAHQIPEGDAIRGFLGEADTRITPVDVVLGTGTGYGGTRYGLWYNVKDNWLESAFTSGHTNITNGEYSAMSQKKKFTFEQLKYMFMRGVQMVHLLFTDNPKWLEAEVDAVKQLKEENTPRPGTTGGTGQVRAIRQPEKNGTKLYNIVQIGEGENHNGMLKSVNQDGSWEGTVYLVPFHSRMIVESIAQNDKKDIVNGEIRLGAIKNLQYGEQVEIRFNGKKSGVIGKCTLDIYHGGVKMPGVSTLFDIGNKESEFRYVLKNQLPLDDVYIVMTVESPDGEDINLSEINVTVQRGDVARRYFGKPAGTAHRGGVNFDILSREYVLGLKNGG